MAPADTAVSSTLSRPVRWLFASLGAVATALAVVGAILPGVPTTIFLIIASYCFTRSCPWLEERLLSHRLFAPYAVYVRRHEPMPRRARLVALLLMWASVSFSLAWLSYTGWLSPRSGAVIVGAALAGSVAVALVGRTRTTSARQS